MKLETQTALRSLFQKASDRPLEQLSSQQLQQLKQAESVQNGAKALGVDLKTFDPASLLQRVHQDSARGEAGANIIAARSDSNFSATQPQTGKPFGMMVSSKLSDDPVTGEARGGINSENRPTPWNSKLTFTNDPITGHVRFTIPFDDLPATWRMPLDLPGPFHHGDVVRPAPDRPTQWNPVSNLPGPSIVDDDLVRPAPDRPTPYNPEIRLPGTRIPGGDRPAILGGTAFKLPDDD